MDRLIIVGAIGLMTLGGCGHENEDASAVKVLITGDGKGTNAG